MQSFSFYRNLFFLTIVFNFCTSHIQAEAPNLDVCNVVTTTFNSTDIPKVISAVGTNTITSVINVAGAGTYILDVDLNTSITHTFNADLDITLQSPSGTITTITTDNATNNDNVFNGTLFDDQADTPVSDHTYVNLTTATPLVVEGALGKFKTEDPNGNWTLSIADDVNGDGGNLTNWSLTITACNGDIPGIANTNSFTNSTPVDIIDNNLVNPAFSVINVTGMSGKICNLTLQTNITHSFAADMEIYLAAPNGSETTISTDNGSGNDNVFSNTIFTDNSSNIATDHIYVNNVPVADITPEGALSKFDGLDPNGEWKLTVADDLASDSGVINSWTLNIETCGQDADQDTVADITDNCPDVPNTIQTDIDADNFGDACDECSANPNKVTAGACGCAVVDTDADSDGTFDCNDSCPTDASKSAPGVCGCGIAELDVDNSGITDCLAAQEVANIKAKLAEVKFTTNTSKLKKAKAKGKQVTQLVKGLEANITNNSSSLIFTAGNSFDTAKLNIKDLKKFVNQARKNLKLGNKAGFTLSRKKANGAANKLQSAFAK